MFLPVRLVQAAAFTGLVALLLWRDVSLSPDERIHLWIFDTGQGDSLLLQTPAGLRVLIDGGPNSQPLVELGLYVPLSDQRVDMIVLTHPHRDHLVSLPAIMRSGMVRQLLLSGPLYSGAEYRVLLREAALAGATVIPSDPSETLDLGNNLSLDILWPPVSTYGQVWDGDINNSSVTLALRSHGHCLALLTGDLEAPGEQAILASGADVHCDILKVGHHGSDSSTTLDWLLAVRPSLAIISVGAGNTYGHPHTNVLQRLTEAGIPVKRTDQDGTLSFAWDEVP